MALDTGTVNLRDGYDASSPIRIARFTITDYHGKNRWLSVPEILVYSSNIGAAKMAVDVGTRTQRAYLAKFGLLGRPGIELPEVGRPLTPARWREINTMTISYGHGIAVSPLQLTAAVAAIANGGILPTPTLLKRKSWQNIPGRRVLSAKTSAKMRRLMRLVVRRGTGRKAEVAGYRVGGKTGTADKPGPRGYGGRRVIASFVSTFPTDAPRYAILALLDEPKGTEKTHGYATGGWLAAPVVGHMVRRMAPLLGIAPSASVEKQPRPGDALFLANAKRRAPGWRRQVAAH
jgi:cell division protein FtsI (penicillin-binding protein 3)